MDDHIPKFTTNLVYLTSSATPRKIEQTVLNSILHAGTPKRADIYWFIHVNVLDEPYAMRYKVDAVVKNDVYFIEFNLGFRIEPRVDYFFRQVVNNMISNTELDISSRSEFDYQQSNMGDFRFVVMDSFLSFENDMPAWKHFIMKSFYNLRYVSVKEHINFGLDQSNLVLEKYPLVVSPVQHPPLIREI